MRGGGVENGRFAAVFEIATADTPMAGRRPLAPNQNRLRRPPPG
jgi:hypothetical protein